MKAKKISTFVGLIFFLSFWGNAGQRKVLVEMFTNSHCVLCPPAHNALKSYANSSTNAGNTRYIYYHNRYPYPSDPLFQANQADADGRANAYFGRPLFSTPRVFIDGRDQGTSVSSSALDSRVTVNSPLELTLTGARNGATITVNATIKRTGSIPSVANVLHVVVVENSTYVGNNGVSPQNFVMRSMVTSPDGEAFTIELGEVKAVSKTITLSPNWIPASTGIVVFVQNSVSKEVFQSEYIAVTGSTVTKIENGSPLPQDFQLEQNHPNPFNPSTRFEFRLGARAFVQLKLFDILGNERAALVSEEKEPGTYSVHFDARNPNFGIFSSGVYFYRMYVNGASQTRKMILTK